MRRVRPNDTRTAPRRCLSKRNFDQRRNADVRPNTFLTNGKTPLFVQTYFLRTPRRRYPSRRIFNERQNGGACPDGISTNGKTPLPVQTHFRRTATRRYPSRRIFSQRQNGGVRPDAFSTNGDAALTQRRDSTQSRRCAVPRPSCRSGSRQRRPDNMSCRSVVFRS